MAPALLGCFLIRVLPQATLHAAIVETEAYLPDDPACHAFTGPTARNRSMFGPAGRAYVYRIHRSVCLNVVTGKEGSGQAVLVRAVEPVSGHTVMADLRAAATVGRSRPAGYALTNGPGKLCQALDIGIDLDGTDLVVGPELRLLARTRVPQVRVSKRIGISKSRDLPLRFSIAGNPWVSAPVSAE